MRVAYVCMDPGVPVHGSKGCSVHVQEIVRALVKRGAAVDIFAARTGDRLPPGFGRVRVHHLAFDLVSGPGECERAALAANNALRAALARQGPFDLLYERYSLWSFAGLEYAATTGIPGLLEVNAPLIDEHAERRGLTDRAAAERTTARAFAAASALLAVSQGVAEYLEQFQAARGRVHVVPNGVDPERIRPGLPPTSPAPAGHRTIGFVGTLKPWHDLGTLVAAFGLVHRAAPGTRLLIVGTGPEQHRVVEDLQRRHLLDAAHFTGAVPPEDVPGLLASMDVAVAPAPGASRFYFSPLKLFEYMAAGLPIVASDIGQIAEVIQHGVNGLLCPPDDPPALADALEQVLCDARLRARLGQAARAAACRAHTWDQTTRRILEISRVGLVASSSAEVRA